MCIAGRVTRTGDFHGDWPCLGVMVVILKMKSPNTCYQFRAGLGSIHFLQFNSIPIQVGFGIFQFNSIPIQIGFRIFQFNSNSIPIQFIQFQFNSIQILCTVVNKSIRKHFKTGSFKFNLSIPLFAAQFRKYMQDHNKSRIN